MTTTKQKNTVHYIERWLGIKYRGNIECYQTVSCFISKYFDEAKRKNTLRNMDFIFGNKPLNAHVTGAK